MTYHIARRRHDSELMETPRKWGRRCYICPMVLYWWGESWEIVTITAMLYVRIERHWRKLKAWKTQSTTWELLGVHFSVCFLPSYHTTVLRRAVDHEHVAGMRLHMLSVKIPYHSDHSAWRRIVEPETQHQSCSGPRVSSAVLRSLHGIYPWGFFHL